MYDRLADIAELDGSYDVLIELDESAADESRPDESEQDDSKGEESTMLMMVGDMLLNNKNSTFIQENSFVA